MSIDDSRKTTVPTYTLDLLISSLEGPDLGRVKLDEENERTYAQATSLSYY